MLLAFLLLLTATSCFQPSTAFGSIYTGLSNCRARPVPDVRLRSSHVAGSGQDDLSTETELDFEAEEYLNSVISRALSNCEYLMKSTGSEEETLPQKLQDLFNGCEQSVEGKLSTISNAGRGLFVSKAHIPPGTIVSFYPIHAVGANLDGVCIGAAGPEDRDFFETSDTNYMVNLIGDPPFPGGARLMETFNALAYVDMNPNRKEQPGWLAHLINDCAIIDQNTEPCVLDYYDKVLEGQNCAIIPFGPAPICAAVTTKDVYEGDELFVSYGYSYWMDALNAEEDRDWTERTEAILIAERAAFGSFLDTIHYVEERYAEEANECMGVFNDLDD